MLRGWAVPIRVALMLLPPLLCPPRVGLERWERRAAAPTRDPQPRPGAQAIEANELLVLFLNNKAEAERR